MSEFQDILFPVVRCQFHNEEQTISNIYIAPSGLRDPEKFSLQWVDAMAYVLFGSEDSELKESFIACFKSPLTSKEQADLAYQLAKRYCELSIDHVRQQAEQLRDELLNA